jgi:putative ABC transport system permease protein
VTGSRSTSILTTLSEGVMIALDSLRTSKTRAGLTILGIAIGVMVVMGMSAAVKGINSSFENAIASVGPKTFFVFRYFQGGIQVGGGGRNAPWRHNPPISEDESKMVARLPDVRDVIMSENRNATVQVGNQSEDNVVIAGRGAA